MSNPAIVVDPAGELPTRYYGEAAVAARFGVSRATVQNWVMKRGLPLVPMPCSGKYSRRGWRYYTDEELLGRWLAKLASDSRDGRLRRKQAKTETVRERCIRRGRKVPSTFATAEDHAAGNVRPDIHAPSSAIPAVIDSDSITNTGS